MLQEAVEYLDLDNRRLEDLYNDMKEHKLRELFNIGQVIHTNIHRLDLADIEYYKDELLQRVDNEIDEIGFNTFVTTYEEDYKKFMGEYKGKLVELFEEFLCVPSVNLSR